MKSKFILLLLSLLILSPAFAQQKGRGYNKAKTSNKLSISAADKAARFVNLGDEYLHQKDYRTAVNYILEARKILTNLNNPNERYWYAAATARLGRWYLEQNNLQMASICFREADSLYNITVTRPTDGSHVVLKNYLDDFHKSMNDNYNKVDYGTINAANVSSNYGFVDCGCNKHIRDNTFVPLDYSDGNFANFHNYSSNVIHTLNISNNDFKNLHSRINQLQFLEELDVSNNKLKEWPNFSNLKNLHKLNLSGNDIRRIEFYIGDLKCLEYLDISCNPNLQYIDYAIKNLKNLKVLNVSGTKISSDYIHNMGLSKDVHVIYGDADCCSGNITYTPDTVYIDEDTYTETPYLDIPTQPVTSTTIMIGDTLYKGVVINNTISRRESILEEKCPVCKTKLWKCNEGGPGSPLIIYCNKCKLRFDPIPTQQ
ncbi:MAG: leucine-rich repeat domain-containing protein [Ignavibacteria bacterium]|jgi:hypothetical protein|nr:leucine-rich repeat domain-containing protein [Ignavibacteria bacterium]